MNEWVKDMIMAIAISAWKRIRLNTLWTQDLRVASAMLYQLSCETIHIGNCHYIYYLQVNTLSEWIIIGIYLHEFTNNERQISIPPSAVLKISSSLLVNDCR